MYFREFGLDDRLLQALDQLGLEKPTPVQEKSIPLALQEKKDVIAQARTGSGKTLAYCLPIVHNLLTSSKKGNRCIIFVPSRDLADQITNVLASLLVFAHHEVTYTNISQQVSDSVRRSMLTENPSIIVGTPAAVRSQIEENFIAATNIDFVVFDEADLLVSYGYKDDLIALHELLPNHAQAWLTTATLSDDVAKFKAMFCRKPVSVKLEDTADKSQLKQFYVKCSEIDKFLFAYVIFKLGLIHGKTLVFTNDINRGYQLKLFLEQFGIRSCVLNSELPVSSRLHIVNEFNKNVYTLLIATDNVELQESEKKKLNNAQKGPSDYGVSRGIDFQDVACVLNFDLPISSKNYIHRIGRTARAEKKGMALSFVVPQYEVGKHRSAKTPTADRDEQVLARIISKQLKAGLEIRPYEFDMDHVNRFRYRMEDAFRSVNKVAIREARVKEISDELINSEKLQRHFEENPDDLLALRHDKERQRKRAQLDLRHVPDYLLPANAKIPKPIFLNETPYNHRKPKRNGRSKNRQRDPLRTFSI